MQGSNQIQDFIDILRRRAWQVVLPAMVGLALGNAAATLMPRRYSTTTQLELRETNMPAAGEGMVAQTLMKDVESATYHIKAPERVRRVIEKLEWQDFTALTTPLQVEYLKDVLARITVKPVVARRGGSSFINIKYSDTDPERAEQFLNRLRDAYTSDAVERLRNDARAVRDTLQNQMAIAQETYRDKEKQSTELRRKHGLSNTQQAPGRGPREEDPIYTELALARTELQSTKVKLEGERATLEILKQTYAEEPKEVPQATASNAITYDLQLAEIEAEIQQWKSEQEGIKEAHSLWQRAEAEILKLSEQRDNLIEKLVRPAQETVRLVMNPRRDALRDQIQNKELLIAQLEAQQEQLQKSEAQLSEQHANLSMIYREIQQLDNEVARSKEHYNDVAQRYDRQAGFVELINQPHANPFIVSEEASAPTEHTSPNEFLLLAVGLLLGLGVGLALAVLGEFGHNGYRSVADIGRSLAIPVLGVVNGIVTREETRRLATRKLMIISSTLVLVGAIVWVTWAYENRPRLLGSELNRFVDDLRQQFR